MLDQIRAELGSSGQVAANTTPSKVEINIALDHERGWGGGYGMLVLIVGGMFLLGFAGDMALTSRRNLAKRS